jgi:hypothetical protein
VRRAILVRQFIEEMHKDAGVALLNVEHRAEIDADVLDALLLTRRYHHGVRSLQAIFQMSAIHSQAAISKTAIPAIEQSLMHVDETFFSIIRRNYQELGSRLLEEVLKAVGSDA